MKTNIKPIFLMKKEFTAMSVSQQAEALKRILEEEAVRLAKETGFIERERVISGADFAQALELCVGLKAFLKSA
jgi:hypothetical protein